MLIHKLQEHFPARLPEWWNAFTLFMWGSFILLHPGIFAAPFYDGLVEIAHTTTTGAAERIWGLAAVTVGLVRGAALFVNGSYHRTPLVRLGASAVSAFVWSQVVIGIMLLDRPAISIVVYGSILLLDLVSAYRAACDVVIAQAAHREEAGATKGRGELSSYHPARIG